MPKPDPATDLSAKASDQISQELRLCSPMCWPST